jgi:DNA-binding CsgD family transcriptional regulator
MDWLGWCQALLQEARGDRDGALTTLEYTWQGCADAGVRAAFPLLGPDLARMAAAAGRRDLAEAVATEVGAAAETMGAGWTQAAALRCQALATGDADLALAAIELLATSRRVLEQARACEEAAALLTHRRSEAVLLLRRASGLYQDLRAELGLARVDRSLRALGVRPARRAKRPERPTLGWASLTPTELAVAEEVARGLSNRQIADRLFVSPRTVESHLSHVFAKVGLQTRTELALAMSRQTSGRP